MAFPYTRRRNAHHRARPASSPTFKPGGHWTRSLLASPDGSKLYVGVGSLSNIGEHGMEAEEGRAAIYELDLATGTQPHLRVGPAQPGRPGLGAADRRALDRGQRARRPRRRDAARLPDLGPRRRLLRLALLLLGPDGRRPRAAGPGAGRHGRSRPTTRSAATPPRSASAGCPAGTLPGFPDGMVIGQHGSWNRSKLSGYKVIFVPFENGRPAARRATS